MKTITNYIEENGDLPFSILKFNNVDSAILTLLTYLDFNDIFIKNITLNDLLRNFILYKDKKEYIERGFYQKDMYNLAESLLDKKRYKDMIISNYVYRLKNNEQFGAMTFNFDNTKYIAFEGTDETLVGWEEDLACSYLELTPSDKDAIEYVKKEIKMFDKKIYLGGHSKGGRLALTSSMYLPKYKSKKIINIYNFDGPGLLEKLYNSNKYKNIENKIIHIIPKNSIVGLLLTHNNKYQVANTNRIDVNSHSPYFWEIDDIDFKYTELSTISKKLDISISEWLEKHDNYERKLITKSIFNIFRDHEITTVTELFTFKNIVNIFINNKELDNDTKAILKDFFSYNIKSIIK